MSVTEDGRDELARRLSRLAEIDEERNRLACEIAALSEHRPSKPYPTELQGLPLFSPLAKQRPWVTQHSDSSDKIDLFLDLFTGRRDVYAVRWENSDGSRKGYSFHCANFWKNGCQKKTKGGKCKGCQMREYIPFDGHTVRNHLRGTENDHRDKEFVAGAYALLMDETCRFVVADFDKADYKEDAKAFKVACTASGIPTYLERSRSGNGCHVWVFFTSPVPARHARRMMLATLTKTMEARPDIGFDSYDRLIPNQDKMPKGGLGNLIGLPLQQRSRVDGNSVFVDDEWQPYDDQWAILSGIRRMTPSEVEALSEEGTGAGAVLGLQVPQSEEHADEPWKMKPSRPITSPSAVGLTGKTIKMKLGNQLYIERKDLPSPAAAQFARIGAFQNPKFYSAQAMGLWTGEIPRVISAAEIFPEHIGLPRGCLEEARDLAKLYNAEIDFED
ncbi:hypothetical protein IMCC20628_04520 [Hoeflea sp. IMCC20628]|nr:hypothetical protein IMCC20628_04520 [Hoeflea sp. IMCC20628]